jgi:flagellar basal-body rod protein FlgG
MLYGTYLSAAGMSINQNRQDVIANNLANVDTVGFKHNVAVFKERLSEALTGAGNQRFLPENLEAMTGGAFVANTYTDFSMGSIEPTNQNLDVAIAGSGFFMVQDGDTVRYSRDGRLGVMNGKLVRAADGKTVLDNEGKEISVANISLEDIQINSKGEIQGGEKLIGRLGIVDFANRQNLRHVGGGLYDSNGEQVQQSDTSLIPQAIESSTVNPSMEMVNMIKTSRNYQLNAQMLSMQDETLGKLISELPKL